MSSINTEILVIYTKIGFNFIYTQHLQGILINTSYFLKATINLDGKSFKK